MYKDSLDKQASLRFLISVLLFLFPVFFAQVEIESGIYLKSAEAIVYREIIPVVIIVFPNERSTYISIFRYYKQPLHEVENPD